MSSHEGGTVDISNAEIDGAMPPGDRQSKEFAMEEKSTGIRISLATGQDADTTGRQ
ncbi:hypothetical protein [Actinoplanes lobatus]|uniref:hypothetical protein n=1 Tax=Actinoplanes lobatus TaxID=113568 RepID=UPI0019424255|nr:hypothetical protein [Actinoplanes lobatus]